MRFCTILAFSVIAILCGCSSPYTAKGLMGGFTETQLDENVFRVTFKGNAYTDREKTADYCLLRCAELCIENGYSYFAIIDASDSTSSSSYTAPSYGTTTFAGNTAYTNTYGGQTYNISRPSTSNEIVCFKGKPEGFAYNAAFIVKSLKEKYKISDNDQD